MLSTIRHFRDEYVAHIRDKRCPAGVCPALVRAPCQNACPAAVDVPGFVSLIGEKRYAEALGLHRERNPFASVCARVCFHTCEDKCRRSTLDEPLSIRGLKRFLVEQEVTIQLPEIRDDEKNAKRKIAIVGAGPAGLSCAYFLARLGYRPKVFEAEQRPGGMLVQTIPAYRLPREELAREVRMIERLGVDIQTGMRLGKDFTLKSLRNEGYEAVFLGVGAPQGTNLGVPGEELEGVTDAIGFLREYNIRGSARVGQQGGRGRRRERGDGRGADGDPPRRRVGDDPLSPQPRRDARLRRGDRRGRARGRRPQGARRAGGDSREGRPRRRREVPRHGARRFRPQRPPPPDRDEQRRVRRGGRPGHRRHRPGAGREAA